MRKTRRQRFKVTAQRRTIKVLKGLRVLAKCGNRNFYEYSDEEVSHIFKAIEEAIKDARVRFDTEPQAFKLSEEA